MSLVLMSCWGQMMLNERVSSVCEILSLFHDYSLAVISMILVVVGGLSLLVVFGGFFSLKTVSSMVETVWTVVPMVVLLVLAVPSLKILYYMDDFDPYHTVKVVGSQWF